MKSKPFNRKLKNHKAGFRYYRIWGNPIKEHNVSYHKTFTAPDTVVFEHPDLGWLTLYVCEQVVLNRPYSGLCGSLDGRFFNKMSAALKVLDDYKMLRTSAGLADLCDYHRKAGCAQNILRRNWYYALTELTGDTASNNFWAAWQARASL